MVFVCLVLDERSTNIQVWFCMKVVSGVRCIHVWFQFVSGLLCAVISKRLYLRCFAHLGVDWTGGIL